FDKQLTLKIIDILLRYGIQSVIVEGGKQTLETFITDNLWDEARVFKGIVTLNEGIKAPFLRGISSVTDINSDQLKLFLNHD
ncbi:MAG: Riboflavin biosynthesis protein RibD, partial [Bacteroidota bacterium]